MSPIYKGGKAYGLRKGAKTYDTPINPDGGGSPPPAGTVWEPTVKAPGTIIGTAADPDFIGVNTDDEYAYACPTLLNNCYWDLVDGTPEIIVNAKREPGGVSWTRSRTYSGTPALTASSPRYCSGGFLATFAYGNNWPPQAGSGIWNFNQNQPGVKRSWGLGHRIECQALWPAKDGIYTCFWLMTTNKTNASPQGVIEIDWGENTPTLTSSTNPTNLRTTHFTATHYYPSTITGVGSRRTTGLPDITTNWADIACEFDSTSVRFYFNDVLVLTAGPPKNSNGTVQTDAQLGLMINNHIGYPQNSFRNGYENPFPPDCLQAGQPAASFPLRVRNLRVLAL